MNMASQTYQKARTFVYRNARPLDIARWQYHFEGGSREAVLVALAAYQNEDGGFGHALEPDLWSPDSSPFVTSSAIGELREIGFRDTRHPIVQGILRYLDSGSYRCETGWFLKLPSNNDHPHAPWWTYEKMDAEARDAGVYESNPTATVILAGFALRTAARDSALFAFALQAAMKAIETLPPAVEVERHLLGSYCRLLEDATAATLHDTLPLAAFSDALKAAVANAIEPDTSKWYVEYVATPVWYFNSRESPYYLDNKELAEYECKAIAETQLPDGAWPTPWGWTDYPEQWAVAKNWWRSHLAVSNMLYLQGMGAL